MFAEDSSTCAGTPHGGSCDVRCKSGYWLPSNITCRQGEWQVSSTCQLAAGTANQNAFTFGLIIDAGAGSEMDFAWAQRHVDVLVHALASTLQVNSSSLLLEVQPIGSSSGQRRLTAEGSGTGGSISYSSSAFALIAVMAASTALKDGSLLYRLSTIASQEDRSQAYQILATEFITAVNAELLIHGLPVPQQTSSSMVVVTDQPRLVENMNLPEVAWFVGEWDTCKSACGESRRSRRTSCFEGTAGSCESSAVVSEETCVDHSVCPFDVMCPLGQDGALDCSLQSTLLLVAVILPTMVICFCCFRYIRNLFRPVQNGEAFIKVLDRKVAFQVYRPQTEQQVQNSEGGPTLLNMMRNGNGTKSNTMPPANVSEDGKVHVVWDVDFDKLGELFPERPVTPREVIDGVVDVEKGISSSDNWLRFAPSKDCGWSREEASAGGRDVNLAPAVDVEAAEASSVDVDRI